ncbi:MAG: hypothetical protein ACFCUW_02200 [Kiloniellaceae bacterium]
MAMSIAPRLLRAAGFCGLLALSGGPAVAAGAGYQVEAAEFVVSLDDGEGNERSVVSDLVPYLPNRACFGWRIRLADAPALVRVREVLKLPAAPDFWSGEDDQYSPHTYSADRTTATTEEFAAPKDGWLSNQWCIVEGDPTGAHFIEVFIEDELVRRFDFEVKKPSETRSN